MPAAETTRSPYERLVSDSAAADSAAFATLPPSLAALLDIRGALDAETLAADSRAQCLTLEARREGELRRRLQLRLRDSSTVLLLAVADRTSGRLDRVEFVRRTPGQGQRGLSWDANGDRTASAWWPEFERGGIRRMERGDIPRGGPVPRALRSLGRRLVAIPCADSAVAG